jgi:hypothetical protein
MSTGWIIGYVVTGALVLVVVALLLLMIRGANRAAVKAESILAALEESRDNTAPLWAVHGVNQAVERITEGAAAVREHVAAKTASGEAAGVKTASGEAAGVKADQAPEAAGGGG